MRTKILFALLLGASVWVGCDKIKHMATTVTPKTTNDNNTKTDPGNGNDDGGNDNPATDCSDVICTAEFAGIRVQVQDAGGAPIALDAFYTEDMAGTRLPSSLYEENGAPGAYIIFNDSWLAGHQNTTTTVRFVGFKNGTKVVSEVYNINTDCCHISKASGNDVIVVP